MTFEILPDVVLGKIMSYLHWKEKQLLAIASNRVAFLIESSLAWECFENNRHYAFRNLCKSMQFSLLLDQEIEIIRSYGKYFQRCKLWLYSIDETPLTDWGTGNVILKAVSMHCKQLKWLSIMHPPDATLRQLQRCPNYIKSIQTIALGQRGRCSVSLRNLFYSSMDLLIFVIDEYLLLLAGANLLTSLACLDISHGLISDPVIRSGSHLMLCTNLSTLKCPLHILNSSTIICLSKKKLSSLYLVNDDHTKELGFLENDILNWTEIQSKMEWKTKACFQVHYVFQNRPLDIVDFVRNPFTKSIVFNNLTCSISAALLQLVADKYGTSLENLAFCSNYWEFLMHFTDLHEINHSLGYLGKTCRVLKSFISCLKLPSSAIVSLIKYSKTLRHLRVYRDKVPLSIHDEPLVKFQDKITRYFKGRAPNWQMLNQGENIFEIPGVNPILFGTCSRES